MATWKRMEITTVGANGAATGTGTMVTSGGVLTRVRIPANAAVPTTSDFTINLIAPDGGTVIPFLTYTDVTVPFNAVPQVPTTNAAGAATGSYAYGEVPGGFSVTIAQANAGAIEVWFLIE